MRPNKLVNLSTYKLQVEGYTPHQEKVWIDPHTPNGKGITLIYGCSKENALARYMTTYKRHIKNTIITYDHKEDMHQVTEIIKVTNSKHASTGWLNYKLTEINT
jgi:hypothetical protein